MWFFFLLMVILLVLSFGEGRSKFKFLVAAVILFFIMAFKDKSVGNDTPNYIDLYRRLQRIPELIDATSRFEKGYQLMNKFLGYFFPGYQVLFVVSAIICISSIVYGIRKSSLNWQYSLFLLVSLRFYYFFLSGLRQSIAASLVFVSYSFLKEKKYKLYIFIVLIAMTFHFSAFVFLLAFFITRMKLTPKTIIRLSIGIAGVYVFFGPILSFALGHLSPYYSHYMQTEAAGANNLANYIGALMPLVFLAFAFMVNRSYTFIWDGKELIEAPEDYLGFGDKDIDNQAIFLIIAIGLSLVATRASILDRMVQYYWIFAILFVPNIIDGMEDETKKTIFFLVISFFVMLYNLILLTFRPEWNMIVPYKFFWQ